MPFHHKIKSGFQAFQDERARKKGFSSASEMNLNIAAARHRGSMEGKRIAREKLLRETRTAAKSKYVPSVKTKQGGSSAEQKIQRGLGMARMFLGTDQPPPKQRASRSGASGMSFGTNNFDDIFGTQSIRNPTRRKKKAKGKKKRRKSRPRQTGGPFGDFGY